MPAISLFVRHLPASATSEHLKEIFSEIGPLKNCFVVKDKESGKCRGYGFVVFSMEEDARRALKEIINYDGEKIWVDIAKEKPDEKKRKKAKRKEASEETEDPQKPAETTTPQPPKTPQTPQTTQKFNRVRKNKLKGRLIIRNLSFKCSKEELKQIFSKFGEVLEASIPLKPDGKMRGFAIVQFKNMLQAGNALNAMNLKEIKGRQVAVDWALPKDKYMATLSASAAATSAGSKKEETGKSEGAGAGGKEGAKNKSISQQQKADSESEEEDQSEDEDDDDEDEADDSEEEEQKNESDQMDSDTSEPEAGDEDEDEDDEEEDDDDDDDEEDSEGKSHASPKRKNPLPSDVNEGKTIFIRNLSFDTEEEGLEEVLLQFGEMNYVRVVMHVDTGHSKGCAFAQFKTKEAAEKCIAAAQNETESGGIRVDGRRLIITSAVSREDAAKFKDKKVKTHTGSRNLYLAREGLIRPGTKSAEGVSESDLAKRTRFEELKRAKLKDINVYVSKTRLCVHNLPKSVDQPKLRKLCLSAAGTKGVSITECRVMYDKKPVRGKVMGQSLGYGFVEFKEHDHALQALRQLNNNPDIFGPQKRPIVEFSLEDGRKLKMKAMRLQKSKRQIKQDGSQKGQPPQHNSGKKRGATHERYIGNADKQEKERAQGNQYTGFRTKPEVEHVELQDGKKRQKVLHMPSHRGPKIRNRDKGKQPVQPKKLKKGPSRKEKNMSAHLEKPIQNKKQRAKPMKRRSRNREDDRFDSLVEQYKKKLMGNSKSKTVIKKSKWFS